MVVSLSGDDIGERALLRHECKDDDERSTKNSWGEDPRTSDDGATVVSGECVTDVEFQLLRSAGDGCRSRAVRFLLIVLSSKVQPADM